MSSIPKVLLVEDSDDDAFFFRRTLKKGAIACDLNHVSDGGAAIQLFEDTHANSREFPHVVFLDLKMPVKNGFEVLEWLSAQPFSGIMSVVVLSGSDQEADKNRTKSLGAAGYLVKPVSAETLTHWIQNNRASSNGQ